MPADQRGGQANYGNMAFGLSLVDDEGVASVGVGIVVAIDLKCLSVEGSDDER